MASAGSKRKRDTDQPRITYHAGDRTFDRLFRENSLAELKNVVRTKLGLASDVAINLSQIRGNNSIDLEDDDDFDAFYAAAYSVSLVNVKVSVGLGGTEPQVNEEDTEIRPSKKKRERKNKDSEDVTGSVAEAQEVLVSKPTTPTEVANPGKPLKVIFVETTSGDAEPSSHAERKAKRKQEKMEKKVMADNDSGAPPSEKGKGKRKRASSPTAVDSGYFDAENMPATTTSVPEPDAAMGPEPKKLRRSQSSASKPTALPVPQQLNSERETVPKKPTRRKRSSTAPDEPIVEHSTSPIVQQTDIASAGKQSKTSGAAQNAKKDKKKKNEKQGQTEAEGPTGVVSGSTQLADAITQVSEINHKHLDKPHPTKGEKKQRSKNPTHSIAEPEVSPIANEPIPAVENSDEPTEAAHSPVVEDPKQKKGKKKEAPPAKVTTPSVLPTSDDIKEAMAKMLARRQSAFAAPMRLSGASPETSEDAHSAAKAQPALDQEKPAAEPSSSVGRKYKQPSSREPACTICSQSPLHPRYRCPVIAGGIASMEKRLAELEKDTAGGEDNAEVIQELQGIVKRKRKAEEKRSKVNEQSILPSTHTSASTDSNIQAVSDHLNHVAGSVTKAVAINGRTSWSGKLHPRAQENSSSSESPESDEEPTPHIPPNFSLPKFDVSGYGEAELAAIINGPTRTFSIADVVTPESTEDSDDERENILEEEEEERKPTRRANQRFAASDSSSDDEENAEEDDESTPLVVHMPPPVLDEKSIAPPLEPQSHLGNVSFGDIDKLGSSIEVDKTGDAAFSDALAEDNVIFHLADTEMLDLDANSKEQSTHPTELEEQAVNTIFLETNVDEEVEAEATPLTQSNGVEQQNRREESIEPPDSPKLPNSSPIEENNDSPRQSTPKPGMVQRLRAMNSLPGQALLNSITPILKGRATRSAKNGKTAIQLSATQEIPTMTPRMTRAALRASSQTSQAGSAPFSQPTPAKQPTRLMKPSQSTAQASTKASKKPPVSKTKGKATSIQPAEIEEVEDEMQGEEANPAKPSSPNTWAVLKEPSSAPDADATVMVDELQSTQSSPTPLPPPQTPQRRTTKRGLILPARSDGEEEEVDTAPQDPLFIPSESQIPFPYSQWGSVPVNDNTNEATSSTDSDDEDEVEVAIAGRTRAPSQKPSLSYRRLTDIASQGGLFQKPRGMRPAQWSPGDKEKVTDLYGRAHGEEESEESDSESESDSEAEQKSHIPKSRRAGVATVRGSA
ncbi:hypothetical protein BDQ12DRAFT_717989 [Crucibulum laeve]|uniref:Uncharacterized protein n=1 Tax=Crucibulum laeve TaxID=68775 RepID=A0A5C3MJJ6_9AGAR|nr:hypothetical protein BDQ12DRAFT_717989 [Crucibulum laeve]